MCPYLTQGICNKYNKRAKIRTEADLGNSNRKGLAAATVNLDGKAKSADLEFAPPEVVPMVKGLVVDPELKLTPVAVDVYCWAISFFAIITNKDYIYFRNYFAKYKSCSEEDYKGFVRIVDITFDSIKIKD